MALRVVTFLAAKEWPNRGVHYLLALSILLVAAGCTARGQPLLTTGTTPDQHAWFAINAGTAHELGRPIAEGKMACESCHPTNTTSFKEVMCVNCHGHDQTVTDRLHTTVSGYAYRDSAACYSCHPSGGKTPYDHGGISSNCAMCHDIGNQFAALPRANFTHPPTGGTDCAACHNTNDWKGATGAPTSAHDPTRDLVVTALVPTYAGTSIASLMSQNETLPMPMNHGSTEMPSGAMSDCSNCHQDAASSVYYPGLLHSSLANLNMGQPTSCGSCHVDSMPTGFVGPVASNPARAPSSGEMKHDAVAWLNDAPTIARIVPTDCGLCHGSPSAALQATWASNKVGTPIAQYHPALAAAGHPQPTSCIDCHANTRPDLVLNNANSTLPIGMSFDHGGPGAQGDCSTCHVTGADTQWSSWKLGKFHLAGSSAPSTCLPCHASERPTATAGWISTTYKSSPFDYVANASGTTHGDGQDCAVCHGGPGTGAWGGTQNWAGGHFGHGPQTVSGETCIACHSTQRPDLQPGTTAATTATAIGFDHSMNGAGECFGCHQATVTANSFVNYYNPATRALPGGDWKGGQPYPGSSFASSATQFIKVAETTLNRTGTAGLVTSTTTVTATLYNGMLHVSSIIPAPLAAGPTTAPDNTKCWHCHTNTNGVVTAYKDGQYHASLTSFRSTPAGPVAPFPQPAVQCGDCHSFMLPTGIVQKAGSILSPMDHRIVLASPVTVRGVSVTKISQIDCSTCHKSPGVTWADGVFHATVAPTAVTDCVSCHYVLMADSPSADVVSGVNFSMKHASRQLAFQTCQTCHPSAPARAAVVVGTSWQTGAFHASVVAQPTACNECHTVSAPPANVSSQSAVAYVFKAGGTPANAGQWMNHGSSLVAGKDCVACHAADAKSTGSAWSKSISFHGAAPGAKTCQECHGIANGGGAVAGTRNNLPTGLTNSTVATSASAATGIASGTLAQITHADVNVTGRDCGFCHTQVGVSTAAGIQGQEWAQARFHVNFTTTSALVMNTTTGRCSSCHMNVKPAASYTLQNHSAFTNVSGSTDCSSCHSYPGTGTTASPNWLGAGGGVPTTISVGGFTVARPPATATVTQAGIANLPHPTVAAGASCASCHSGGAGGRNAIGYDHKSTLINSNCNSCHEAGSNLVGTPWNGATATASGAGDTRPYSIVGLVPSTGGGRALSNGFNHFYAADCRECHVVPAGNGLTTTGTTYRSVWKFGHSQSKMSNPSTCNMCHGSPNNIPKG